MRGVAADGLPLSVEWYFVPEDTPGIGFYNRFSSLNYTEGQTGDTALGEDPNAARPWWKGEFTPKGTKRTPCGKETVWQRGYQDGDPTSTTTQTGESACCVEALGGLGLGGGASFGWPLSFSGSSFPYYFPASVIFGEPVEWEWSGSSTATSWPVWHVVTGGPVEWEWSGSSTATKYPLDVTVDGGPVEWEWSGSSTAVFIPATVETDCCPGVEIPTRLVASFVEADEPCWFGVSIPLEWTGSAWSGTGTVGTCGYDLTLTFSCVPGPFPGTWRWNMHAVADNDCVDGDGPDPFHASCSPLDVRFALGAGTWIGACSSEPILAGWLAVHAVDG